MQNAGTSSPFFGRHGQGKKHSEAQSNYSFPPPPHEGLWGQHGPVPRGPAPRQFATTSLQGPATEQKVEAKMPSSTEMKESIQDWLSEIYGVVVADQGKWDRVIVEKHGAYWACAAVDAKGVSLAREGPTAKAVAEKMSTMPMAELRYFGLRFIPRSAEGIESTNPSLQSQGIHHTFGSRAPAAERGEAHGGLSARVKDPEELGRRYIATGMDSMEAPGQPSGKVAGGGRRCFDLRERNSIVGGGSLKEVAEEAPPMQRRKGGYATGQTSGPIW